MASIFKVSLTFSNSKTKRKSCKLFIKSPGNEITKKSFSFVRCLFPKSQSFSTFPRIFIIIFAPHWLLISIRKAMLFIIRVFYFTLPKKKKKFFFLRGRLLIILYYFKWVSRNIRHKGGELKFRK